MTRENLTNITVARVALDVPLSTLFDYRVDKNSCPVAGQLVVIPFSHKEVVGIVMAVADSSALPEDKLKPVIRTVSSPPPLSPELLALLNFCSDYYHFPIGMVALAALPARLRSVQPYTPKTPLRYTLTDTGRQHEPDSLPDRHKVQRRVLQALREHDLDSTSLRALSSTAPQAMQALIAQGLAIEVTGASPAAPIHITKHVLTDEQQAAYEAVATQLDFACFLLHGITGSGKSEVYVHLMYHALQQGGQVLLLVPEINLTPQLEAYFRERLIGVSMVSLHSGLSEGERAKNWLQAQSGEARVVIGTRLAIFTPLPQLKLILVDEEHDGSFKQQDGLRYSARDVAVFRARQHNIPIVLGSATPSLESWYLASSGRYRLLQLKRRANQAAALPAVRSIDINAQPLQEGLSPILIGALEKRLQQGEQSLLFINRRGYAPVLMCTACGWLSECSHCAGKLVLHLGDRSLRCHHCGHQARVPRACPQCGDADLKAVGHGTQRIEDTLQQHFPSARILRVDRDSTRLKGSWNAMREQIRDGQADILVGTQMLAKGHDFPNVTLVGVINSDSALYSADFRASEKLFAQLTQVGGRAGRADKPGEVLIQTQFPNHPLYQALRAHDYEACANSLLLERKIASFPPYVHQAMLGVESPSAEQAKSFIIQAREAALALEMPVEIYSAVPATMPKRANHHRWQLLIQCEQRKPLHVFLADWRPWLEIQSNKQVRWILDIDPMDF